MNKHANHIAFALVFLSEYHAKLIHSGSKDEKEAASDGSTIVAFPSTVLLKPFVFDSNQDLYGEDPSNFDLDAITHKHMYEFNLSVFNEWAIEHLAKELKKASVGSYEEDLEEEFLSNCGLCFETALNGVFPLSYYHQNGAVNVISCSDNGLYQVTRFFAIGDNPTYSYDETDLNQVQLLNLMVNNLINAAL